MNTADDPGEVVPLAVRPCAQATAQRQRAGVYLPECREHPGVGDARARGIPLRVIAHEDAIELLTRASDLVDHLRNALRSAAHDTRLSLDVHAMCTRS